MANSLFVLFCLFCASQATHDIVDDVGLVQKDISFQMKSEDYYAAQSIRDLSARAACTCVDWQDAYTKHKAKCGMGHESDMSELNTFVLYNPTWMNEFCTQYYESLNNNNVCMNTKFGFSKPRQWCYVSSECSIPGQDGRTIRKLGGVPEMGEAPTSLKIKICTQGQDEMLGDKSVEDLKAWAKDNNLELSLAAQFAYPTLAEEVTEIAKAVGAVHEGERWMGHHVKLSSIMEFFGLESLPDLQAPIAALRPKMSDELRAQVQQVVDSGKPTLVYEEFLHEMAGRGTARDARGKPPFAIIEGKKLYYLNESDEYKQLTSSESSAFSLSAHSAKSAVKSAVNSGVNSGVNSTVWAHKAIMHDLKCVAGC